MKYISVSINTIKHSMRMDGSYHNADINIYDNTLQRHSTHCLKFYCSNIYTTGRGCRVYTLPERGVPFLSNSDMMTQNPLMTCNFMSRKYGYDESAVLKGGMILTGRVGAIGQTAFVPKYWERHNMMGSDNIIRIVVKEEFKNGFIYAYLASKYGNLSFWKQATGGVQPFITDKMVANLPIPDFHESFKQEIDDLIQESAKLREEAANMLSKAKFLLKQKANLKDLTPDDYDYYGARAASRKVSCFSIRRKNITTTTINAFNLSERIKNTKKKLRTVVSLKETLLSQNVFSTGSFSRIEVASDKGIMLINQSDIFDTIIKGKRISRRNVKIDNLVNYGEVLIAGVGTLGDSEKFCHVVFANEDLVGQLVSGEFIRMKTIKDVPSGYLFAWLDTDFGFRLIRNTQSGTKLCRPIPKLLLEIPVPIIDNESMLEIDKLIREAHTKHYKANCNERKAISMVEQEIESWTISKKN